MKRSTILGTALAAALLGVVTTVILRAAPVTINLQPFSTTFDAPVGIDFWGPPHRQLITTENYPGPVQPRLIDPVTGVNSPFPALIPGTLDNEIKISTVQASSCQGGFQANDVFFPNGQPGEIVRVTDNGATVLDPWVTLPAPGDIQIRGSMFQDRYCAFGGDLIVVTGYEQSFFYPDLNNHGSVWRINAAGVATLIVDLKKHLEGVVIVPNDPVKYGLLAGRILAGDEDRLFGPSGEQLNGPYGKVFAIKSAADIFYIGQNPDPNFPAYQFYPVADPLHPEDIDIVPHSDPTIPADGDFFGIDYGGGRILHAPASDFATLCGELLVTQEFPVTNTSGLALLRSGPSGFEVVPVLSTGVNATQWEHVTFSGGSDCAPPPLPHIKIVKLTNGVDANNPDAAGVPVIAPGGTVTWTYAVTNDGTVDIPEGDVTVTDNIVGPITSIVNKGNGDGVLSPGETWLYQQTGTALNLATASGPNIVAGQCHQGSASNPGGNAYTNLGTVTIPSMSSSDPDSYCNPPVPGVTIIKYTNGADANNPNAAGVPSIAPGATVTWTYKVTNTGQTSIPRAQVLVTDNTTGVVPAFASEISGNGDAVFNPGEVWLYSATGVALDLTLPAPAGVHVVANSCTAGGLQPPRTAYTNIGTVTIPGGTASDPSSYCNPPPPGLSTATIGFWANKNGQAVIDCVNGGPTAKNLATWLSTNFPYLYGSKSSHNLTGKTNADVASLFVVLFNAGSPKTDAQVMAAALSTYVTSSTLAGGLNCGSAFGFHITTAGIGGIGFNVGSNGTLIGLLNNTSYTVMQLLQQANLKAKSGPLGVGFNDVFSAINQLGDIK